MNIILPGESGVSKYDDDPNAPLYIEDKDIKMTREEKKHWMAGDDVPAIQATNPWSMQVDDTNVDKDFHKQTLEMPQQPANQILTLGKADFNQNINNLTSILQDILAGDVDAMKRPEFNALNFPAIKAYLEWAIKTNRLSDLAKCDLMSNAWRLNFKCRPPTPEEFLTEKFIGAQAEALHPWLRDTFIEFFDPLKPYRTLILTQHIGSGKAQPYTSKVAVNKKEMIDFDFGDEILSFEENDYVLTKNGFEQAKFIKVDFPVPTNLLIMSIYDCRNIDEFEFAFNTTNYDDLISFFKSFDDSFYTKNDIRIHKHHIIPKSEGGEDVDENIIKLPIYFHIKAHYLRALSQEAEGNLNFAYKNYKAVQCAIDRNIDIPKNYKDFLKELDVVVESMQRKQYLDRKTKYVYNNETDTYRRVFEFEVNEYLQNGWELKGPDKNNCNKMWVNKDCKNYYIEKHLLNQYLADGFAKGMYKTSKMLKAYADGRTVSKSTLNTKWMHKDGIRKAVNINDVDDFLKDGWVLGSASKTCKGQHWVTKSKGTNHWYTNGKITVVAKECPEGFWPGRTYANKKEN